jgi:hypothetical protein
MRGNVFYGKFCFQPDINPALEISSKKHPHASHKAVFLARFRNIGFIFA